MIRMIQNNSAQQAKDYFNDELGMASYYLDGQELNGCIQGKLAERLGIAGPTTKEAFHALCENIHPKTGKQLTPRKKVNNRPGCDINFHAPKSFSILNAFCKDGHLLKVFQLSTSETMQDIEADAQTRVRKDDRNENRQTGELAWANFPHLTARPVDGSLPDMHMHEHFFVFNATWDEIEQKVKAAELGDVKRDMPYYQARFHKRLADHLMNLGYQIRRTDTYFEIEGVPQAAIDLFSKRTDAIGRFAKEKGITGENALSELGARTRCKKQKGLSMAELRAEWRRQILALGPDGQGHGDQAHCFALNKSLTQKELTAQDCVDFALLHCFERASVLQGRRLLEASYRHSLGSKAVSLSSVSAAFDADSRIIQVKEKNRMVCTTKEVLREEKRMVDLARSGFGKMRPLFPEAPALKLEGQQYEAASHVLTTADRVSIIKGQAGTGKTTLLKELVPMIEKAGKQVLMVAPTAAASRGVLRDEGFAEAETLAKLLIDPEMQNRLENQVLILEEGGLAGTKDMTAALEIAEEKNARLIIIGDTRQHAPVVRGDALRILSTVAGIRSAEVSRIYRQKHVEYRSAVEDLAKGDVKGAFEKLDKMGAIKSIDPMQPNKQLVSDYIERIKKGRSCLVVSPTHAQGLEVTEAIRKALRKEGKIGQKELTAFKMNNLNLTEAEKSDWRNFKEGQVIQFNQNTKEAKRGSAWTVARTSAEGIALTGPDGEKINLPVAKSKAFDVFDKGEIGLSKKDQLRITRNGFDLYGKRLNNGQMLEVVSVKKDGQIVMLRNKQSKVTYELQNSFGHIAHAYCVTSHASQGKTSDEVFISQPASTFPATDAKQFYVSVSRGRDAVHIYTDDKDQLLAHASEKGSRQSAMELLEKQNQAIELINQQMHYEFEQVETPAGEKKKDNTPIHKANVQNELV